MPELPKGSGGSLETESKGTSARARKRSDQLSVLLPFCTTGC